MLRCSILKYRHPGESDRIWRDIIGIHRSTMFSKETFPKPWPPWILFCWCLLSQLFVTQPVPAGWCTMRQENCKNVLQLAVRVAWGTRGSVVPVCPVTWFATLWEFMCSWYLTSDVSWYLFMSLFFDVQSIWPCLNAYVLAHISSDLHSTWFNVSLACNQQLKCTGLPQPSGHRRELVHLEEETSTSRAICSIFKWETLLQ